MILRTEGIRVSQTGSFPMQSGPGAEALGGRLNRTLGSTGSWIELYEANVNGERKRTCLRRTKLTCCEERNCCVSWPYPGFTVCYSAGALRYPITNHRLYYVVGRWPQSLASEGWRDACLLIPWKTGRPRRSCSGSPATTTGSLIELKRGLAKTKKRKRNKTTSAKDWWYALVRW